MKSNVNKLTPGHNVFWESSRMIIPQHKEAAVRRDRDVVKRTRPELTEEETQEMFGKLAVSKSHTLPVTITVFGAFEDRVITGVVTGLDQRRHIVKIEADYDWQLVDFVDVVRVEIDY